MSYLFTTIDDAANTQFNRVQSINDAGQLGGFTGSGLGDPYSSYLANDYGALSFAPIVDLNYGGTDVSALNNLGVLVGRVVEGGGNSYGAIDSNGSVTPIIDPNVALTGRRVSYFMGVNDLGVAVGAYYDTANVEHGRVYTIATGVSAQFDVPGATSTVLNGIDNAGVIVGTLFVAGTSSGFVDADGVATFLDGPNGSSNSSALGINNQGQVVGQYRDSGGHDHGYVYSVADNSYATIDDPDAATGMVACGINDQGQVVGSYKDAAGARHGFIANPITGVTHISNPTPGTILSAAPGSTGLEADGVNPVTLVNRTGGPTGISLIANGGNDVLVSIGSPDTLVGGAGNDVFFTGAAASTDYLGGGKNIVVTGGDATVVATTGDDTIWSAGATSGKLLASGGTGGTLLVVTGAADSTLVDGAGKLVAFAGAGRTAAYGGSGQTESIGGPAPSYFTGGTGDATVYAGTGGGVFVGGTGNGVFVSRGHTTITAGNGPSQIYAGDGDTASLVGAANNVVAGSTGNVTLIGGGSTGNNLFLLGDGQDSVHGGQGSDIFYLGGGFGQITGGAGPDVYAATKNVGGLDLIHGFRVGIDHLVLNGFGGFEARTALATQQNSGGTTTLNLTDGTKLTFEGVAHMAANVFG